jgi:hypothetical protein
VKQSFYGRFSNMGVGCDSDGGLIIIVQYCTPSSEFIYGSDQPKPAPQPDRHVSGVKGLMFKVHPTLPLRDSTIAHSLSIQHTVKYGTVLILHTQDFPQHQSNSHKQTKISVPHNSKSKLQIVSPKAMSRPPLNILDRPLGGRGLR